jgi:alkaline phosphatase
MATLFLLFLAATRPSAAVPIRNVVLCIGDGMGPEQVKAARYFAGTNLVFETFPYQSRVTTAAAGGALTDSAAASTAMATGHKVNDGVLSLAIPGDSRKLETLLEYFCKLGKSTGLVTTSYLTDATPAGFGAHEASRSNYADIALDYFGQTRPNVLFGGGGNGMAVVAAQGAGYQVVTNAASLAELSAGADAHVAGLFGAGSLPYVYDGLGALPKLSQMVKVALGILDKDPEGLFLLVEAGRIDHAAHANNLPRCVAETVAFDEAVRTLVAWARGRTDTLILVTADHETGGLTVLKDNGAGVLPDIKWGTGGHTFTPVPVYGLGVNAGIVTQTVDNVDIHAAALSDVPSPALEVRVSFDSQGGTVSPLAQTCTVGAAYGTLPTPVRGAGYAFGGWWTGAGGTGEQVTEVTRVAATSAQTLYAKWAVNLVLSANGGVLESFTSQYDAAAWKALNLTDGAVGSFAHNWVSTVIPGTQTFEYSFSGGQGAKLTGLTLVNAARDYNAKDFQLWISANGSNAWTKIAEGTLANNGQPQPMGLSSQFAKRVRLMITSGYRSDYWELAEFELYGYFAEPTPVCTIERAGSSPTNADTLNFAINFSAPVTGFVLGDITQHATGTVSGMLGGFIGSGSSYTVQVQSVTGEGGIGVSVAAGVCQDASGKSNEVAEAVMYMVDNTPPAAGTAAAPASQRGGTIAVSYSGASDAGSGLKQVELWFKKDGGNWQDSGLRGNVGSGRFPFIPPALGTYDFDLTAEDLAGNRSAAASGAGDARTVYTAAPPSTNLVLQANGGVLESFASQYDASAWKALNLTDGAVGSFAHNWVSTVNPGPQTFEYSFSGGKSAQLSRLTLINATRAYNSKDFELWIMAPGSNMWTKVAAGSLADNGLTQPFDLDGQFAQRVRLVLTSGYTSAYWELAEFELYGYFDTPMRPSDVWYTAHGLARGLGETWEDLDSRCVPGKKTTLWQEYMADTDPNDTNSVFRVSTVNPGPPVVIHFVSASTGRVYTLEFTDNMRTGSWSNVTGAKRRAGTGGVGSTSDTTAPAGGHRFYRMKVELPSGANENQPN